MRVRTSPSFQVTMISRMTSVLILTRILTDTKFPRKEPWPKALFPTSTTPSYKSSRRIPSLFKCKMSSRSTILTTVIKRDTRTPISITFPFAGTLTTLPLKTFFPKPIIAVLKFFTPTTGAAIFVPNRFPSGEILMTTVTSLPLKNGFVSKSTKLFF